MGLQANRGFVPEKPMLVQYFFERTATITTLALYPGWQNAQGTAPELGAVLVPAVKITRIRIRHAQNASNAAVVTYELYTAATPAASLVGTGLTVSLPANAVGEDALDVDVDLPNGSRIAFVQIGHAAGVGLTTTSIGSVEMQEAA
jgi:hypothetical protein